MLFGHLVIPSSTPFWISNTELILDLLALTLHPLFFTKPQGDGQLQAELQPRVEGTVGVSPKFGPRESVDFLRKTHHNTSKGMPMTPVSIVHKSTRPHIMRIPPVRGNHAKHEY